MNAKCQLIELVELFCFISHPVKLAHVMRSAIHMQCKLYHTFYHMFHIAQAIAKQRSDYFLIRELCEMSMYYTFCNAFYDTLTQYLWHVCNAFEKWLCDGCYVASFKWCDELSIYVHMGLTIIATYGKSCGKYICNKNINCFY